MLLLYGTKRGSISVGLETALTALVEQCSTSNEMGIRVASMALAALTSDGVQATKWVTGVNTADEAESVFLAS